MRLIIGLRRRMSNGFDLSASYTLSDARSIIGTANDELDANNIQDATDPFNAGQHRAVDRAPTRATACRSAPSCRRRGASRSRRSSSIGRDCRRSRSKASTLNNDGNVNDITARAYDVSRASTTMARRRSRSRPVRERQLQPPRAVLAAEPAPQQVDPPQRQRARRGDRRGVQPVQRQEPGAADHLAARQRRGRRAGASFMQPVAYAGDIQQPEQRIGQLGFRFSF